MKQIIKDYNIETKETKTFEIDVEPTEQELAQSRILELKQFLSSTDYQPLKYLDGEYTEEEYAVLKAQRQAWREEIRQLEEKCETTTEEKPKNKPQMIVT